jgi:hypothetical protein
MSTKDEIEKLLDSAAKQVAAIVPSKDAPIAEKVSAFKALTTYYGLRFKKEPPTDKNGPDSKNFLRFEQNIQEAEDGGKTPVRGGSGGH